MPGSPFVDRPRFQLRACVFDIALGDKTLVMGVLNCTPDSFFDGNEHLTPTTIASRLEQIVKEGADWVDVGGESTRPGAEPVTAEEEWERIRPALESARIVDVPLPISVDTSKAEVAERALDLGASILNDVSGLRFEPRLADLAAESGAALVLMHMRGEPRTMQESPEYTNLLQEVSSELSDSVDKATERGVSREQLVIDPGIGFGKLAEQNLSLVSGIPHLAQLRLPVMIGASRKSFLETLFGFELGQRLEGSVATHVAAALAGAHIVRVHDVLETVRALKIVDAMPKGHFLR